MLHHRRSLIPLLAPAFLPMAAHAGMASFSITEAASTRLDVISFFIAVFITCAYILRWAWNLLAKDFTRMPSIGFKQAFAMMLVSGLFLYVILTMISGARELMTPGAWVKNGLTYDLAPPERDAQSWLESARRGALEKLHNALLLHARQHNGSLPVHRDNGQISAELWAGVHPQHEPLGYIPGHQLGKSSSIIVFEPDTYGSRRFALQADGSVVKLSAGELAQRLVEEMEKKVKP